MLQKIHYFLLTISFLCFNLVESEAQDKSLGWFLKKQKSQELPFYTVHNLIIIPISINNSDTLRFILDTGVRTTIISEMSYRDSLGLYAVGRIKMNGYGSGESLEALVSDNNQLVVGRVRYDSQRVLVLMQDVFSLSQKMGIQVHGIIGYEVFKDFVVEIDYEHEVVKFHDASKHYKRHSSKNTPYLPITIEKEKPYVQAFTKLSNDSLVSLKLLVDTGGSHALWLFKESTKHIEHPPASLPVYLGRGLNGDVRGHLARFNALFLDKYELRDILVAYPDEASLASTRIRKDVNGSIGAEILKRFNMTIDYTHQRLYIKPNKFFYKPFEHNMSGMEVCAPYPNLPIFVVNEIKPGSPAEEAGLQTDDQIVSMGSFRLHQLTLNRINSLLAKEDGKKVRVRVLRNGKGSTHIITLKRLI